MSCEIFVIVESGKTISVCVDSMKELRNMTVEELIRRVRPDLPYDKFIVVYAGKSLDYARTLGDYGVTNGCTMHNVLRLCGGGGGPPPDEDKGVPRTGSMEKLANMRQEESSGSCCII